MHTSRVPLALAGALGRDRDIEDTAELKRRSFSDYWSVSLVAGLVAGLLIAWPKNDALDLLAAPALLLIPGVVRRSGKRILLAFLGGIVPLGVANIVSAGPVEGLSAAAPVSAFLGFTVAIDVIMMFMRRGIRDWRAGAALVLSNAIVVALLYPVRSIAELVPAHGVSFDDFVPLWASAAVFVLIFPVKYMLFNYLYAPELFTRPYGEGNVGDDDAWWP